MKDLLIRLVEMDGLDGYYEVVGVKCKKCGGQVRIRTEQTHFCLECSNSKCGVKGLGVSGGWYSHLRHAVLAAHRYDKEKKEK